MTVLYDFFRSSSCYRVRIALNIKNVPYERKIINFRNKDQMSEEYLAVNPQGLVPTLEIDGMRLSQSLAIIDYLENTRPEPRLMPSSPAERAKVLSLSLAIACDIHPINNLRILERIRQTDGFDNSKVTDWYRHWVGLGLESLEKQVDPNLAERVLINGPTLFEICLIPQLYNARRYDMDLTAFPTLTDIEEAALSLPAFKSASPEQFAPEE